MVVNQDTGQRRTAIGDAAIAIIARGGLRALTHRAVDRKLSLPPGSTSYYVRTRRQLIEAAVRRLAERTAQDLDRGGGPEQAAVGPLTPALAAAQVARTLEAIADRRADNLARYALAVDLTNDPELHPIVTSAAPVRDRMLAAAGSILARIGADPVRAPELVALVDGLIFDRLAGSGYDERARVDAEAVIAAYLTGLTCRMTSADLGTTGSWTLEPDTT